MVEFVSIAAWVDKQKDNHDEVTRKILFDIDKGFQLKSPVDTGRFKANWQLGVDFQPSGYDYSLGSNAQTGVIDTAVLSAHAAIIPKDAAGHVYWLVNNLPYANDLENGHSRTKAPYGIVNITLIKFEGIVQRAMNTIK